MSVLDTVREIYAQKAGEPVYIGDLIERLGGPGDAIRAKLYALTDLEYLRHEAGGWVPADAPERSR